MTVSASATCNIIFLNILTIIYSVANFDFYTICMNLTNSACKVAQVHDFVSVLQ
jgi:hypothetical protein